MSLLTMVKFLVYPKKKKTPLESAISNAKPVKTANLIIEQEKRMIKNEKRGKRMKKLFQWIGKYWQQLVGLLGALLYTLGATFFAIKEQLDPIVALLPQGLGWEIAVYVVYAILTLLIGYYLFRNQIKWVGVGSIEKATEYIANKGNQIANTLSVENKKKFQSMLSEAQKGLKVANNGLTLIQAKYDIAVKEYETQKQFLETLQNIGAESTTIQNAQSKLTEFLHTVNGFANELNNAKVEIAKLEKTIADYKKALGQ